MRIWHWVIVASLQLTLSANAQQSAYPAASGSTAAASAPSSPSSAMDQVVDRAVEREHALMEMLKTRTPIVETYLQNLKFDPKAGDRKSTRLNSSHSQISYAVFCLKKKKKNAILS